MTARKAKQNKTYLWEVTFEYNYPRNDPERVKTETFQAKTFADVDIQLDTLYFNVKVLNYVRKEIK